MYFTYAGVLIHSGCYIPHNRQFVNNRIYFSPFWRWERLRSRRQQGRVLAKAPFLLCSWGFPSVSSLVEWAKELCGGLFYKGSNSNNFLNIYLAAPGLSCSTRDL